MALPGRPAAAFSGLPSGRILTLNMDVPEAWLVEPVRADLDLDNLRLADLGAAPSLQVRAHAHVKPHVWIWAPCRCAHMLACA